MGNIISTRYSGEKRGMAKGMRKKGGSINEIARKLGISKSTASLWTKNVHVSSAGKERLLLRQRIGGEKGRLRSVEVKRLRRIARDEQLHDDALELISSVSLDLAQKRILCTVFFWCEGDKDVRNGMRFTNSDPEMIKVFLRLFRESFELEEHKFRALVHIHGYHNSETQVAYWSKVTGIPKKQFYASYKKLHTGKRKRDGYQGCISVRYSDVSVARELEALYKEFGSILGD